ncbi:hypothetical protein ACFC1W_10685 [Microbacterium sp. NPDC056003]|uniref:hypothetical protein n=1 Tax=Microbacterium sp. NPDC056003 TaxID=3345676 RepID=UPI0035DB8194
MTRETDALRAPYRPVRPVGAADDGPWPGLLVGLESGERRVLVDAKVLGREWKGWDAPPHGHVLAPIDVVRRSDGHDVALPVCTERVTDLLARRAATGPPLMPGEAVTLAVSVLRGFAELRDPSGVTGEWWLTDAGRPVFVTDAAPRSLRDASSSLLAGVALGRPHEAWDAASAAIMAERPSALELERAEALLFHLAEPLAITTAQAGPGGARPLARYDVHDASAEESVDRRRPWDGLLRHVDADLADLVSRATTRVWRRATSAGTSSRRAPLLVAGAAAAAVVGVGLLWPSGGDDAATAEVPVSSATATIEPEDATPTGSADPVDAVGEVDTDLSRVAGELLHRRLACRGEIDCLGGVMVDPESSWAAGPIDAPREQRAIALLDDFGGVAVLRVDAVDGTAAQLVVIERRDDEWLLRDVHDAAQQP